jgi:glycosyltransferase involved in cell wall biosynthesis
MNTAQPLLTIAVPTYNRNAILLKNLRGLIPQLTDRCELLVIDNCSSTPVSETLSVGLDVAAFEKIRILRNQANVGGNENILRCIEKATGRYVWLLGDDDTPTDDALALILDHIHRYPNAQLFNFHSPEGGHARRLQTTLARGPSEYLQATESIGELLFISSLVLGVQGTLPCLRVPARRVGHVTSPRPPGGGVRCHPGPALPG